MITKSGYALVASRCVAVVHRADGTKTEHRCLPRGDGEDGFEYDPPIVLRQGDRVEMTAVTVTV